MFLNQIEEHSTVCEQCKGEERIAVFCDKVSPPIREDANDEDKDPKSPEPSKPSPNPPHTPVKPNTNPGLASGGHIVRGLWNVSVSAAPPATTIIRPAAQTTKDAVDILAESSGDEEAPQKPKPKLAIDLNREAKPEEEEEVDNNDENSVAELELTNARLKTQVEQLCADRHFHMLRATAWQDKHDKMLKRSEEAEAQVKLLETELDTISKQSNSIQIQLDKTLVQFKDAVESNGRKSEHLDEYYEELEEKKKELDHAIQRIKALEYRVKNNGAESTAETETLRIRLKEMMTVNTRLIADIKELEESWEKSNARETKQSDFINRQAYKLEEITSVNTRLLEEERKNYKDLVDAQEELRYKEIQNNQLSTQNCILMTEMERHKADSQKFQNLYGGVMNDNVKFRKVLNYAKDVLNLELPEPEWIDEHMFDVVLANKDNQPYEEVQIVEADQEPEPDVQAPVPPPPAKRVRTTTVCGGRRRRKLDKPTKPTQEDKEL